MSLTMPATLQTGIVAIDRTAMLRRSRDVLEARTASVNMSPEQVFGAYRGLDGEPWPSPPFSDWEDGVVALTQFENVCDLVESSGRLDIDIVVLVQGLVVPAKLDARWKTLGYDVGYLDSKWAHFSVLLNEVVYGPVASLRDFSKSLNMHLLLDTYEDAARLLETRAVAASAGSDLEEGNMSIFGVLSKR